MWNIIKTNDDIYELMENFGFFDRSCICEIKYRSGAFVGTVSEHFINDDLSLSLILQRRSLGDVQTIELRFTGIHSLRLEPLGKGMECYLTGASASVDERLITFSTWEDFDTVNADSGVVLIKAESLMWRDISDIMQYTA